MAQDNPREKLQTAYEKAEADKKAAEKAAAAQKAVDGVAVAGSGATTFAEIDKWLADNPDAEYFRIDNNGGTVPKARSYQTQWGAWNDNSAAIVGQDIDKQVRDIFRYANVSAAAPRQGKRGEKNTVGMQYSPSTFFADNGFDYKTDYGLIYSRAEYGSIKEQAAAAGKSDQFLSAGSEKKPAFNSDYGKDKGAILTGAGVDDNRRAGLGTEETDSLANESDTAAKAKRKLLG